MQYRRFNDYQRGFSHEKVGTDCEDYADSYADSDGRFYICAVCDGHSDNNCFRSSKGAQFGCEAAIEILSRFFTLYYDEMPNKITITEEVELRLKKSIKQCWEEKVSTDINDHPITDEELTLLSDQVRSLYKSEHGLQNIYGTTFLAFAICKDFCIALHIGDGIMMCVDRDGTYYEPLQRDEKSEMGAPASLCDTDLFSREGAFRCRFLREIPQAVVVSSDGIGDCMDQLQFMELFYSLINKFEFYEQKNCEQKGLNDSQKSYLKSCVKYYAEKENGVEDDCSLAGIYAVDKIMPQVKIPLKNAEQLWRNCVDERNGLIQDYERRKKETIEKISNVHGSMDTNQWLTAKKKTEDLKEALRNIVRNEEEKCRYYDDRLKCYEEYIKRAEGRIPGSTLAVIMPVEEQYLKEDEKYKNLINAAPKDQEEKMEEWKVKNENSNGKAYQDAAQAGSVVEKTEVDIDKKE